MDLVERVRLENDIVEVISEYGVALRRSGKSYRGLCPFHSDRNPSFFVSPDKQLFYCFGCGVGGTVIHFVMRYEGISFSEALKKLARRAGIPLPGAGEKEEVFPRDRLRRTLGFALSFYQKMLFKPEGRVALQYLKERGLEIETIKAFKLGYAPDGWRNLVEAASEAGVDPEDLIRAGVAAKGRDGSSVYDYLRNRIVFPIFNLQGEVVGFSGRSLDGSEPKYLNTPETELFHKGKLLYNLHLAKDEIRRSGRAVLVEGYMDAILPYQHGVRNVVASAGTSLTEDQANLLRRFAREVVVVYDGDEAGLKAASRGLGVLLREGLRVKVAAMPEGLDPDELVREKGAEGLLRVIDSADNLVDFHLKLISRRGDLRSMDMKLEAVKGLLELLANVRSQVELGEYVRRIAVELDLPEGAIKAELKRMGVKLYTGRLVDRSRRAKREIQPRERIERLLVRMLLLAPDRVPKVRGRISPEDLSDPVCSRVVRLMWDEYDAKGEVDVRSLIDVCPDDELRGKMAEMALEASEKFGGKGFDVDEEIEGCLRKLRDFKLKSLESSIKLQPQGDDIALLRQLMELLPLRKRSKHG